MEEEEDEEDEEGSQENEQSKQKRMKDEKEQQEKLQQILAQQKKQHKEGQRTIGNFPVPSREQWLILRYEPHFEINRLTSKYQIQSLIPNLNLKELSIEESEDTVSISGTRFPTTVEEQILVQKVSNFFEIVSTSSSKLVNKRLCCCCFESWKWILW